MRGMKAAGMRRVLGEMSNFVSMKRPRLKNTSVVEVQDIEFFSISLRIEPY